MTTFITRLDAGTSIGPRLAVKDLIDVAGAPTTAGSRALADDASAAVADAPCMRGARLADARVIGKANLFELAYGASGVNDWFGTPLNPLDPSRLPGGSSSGSAVAVASGEADIAYGSDTGGSIRVPSAFCGTAGLKTTHGRIPLAGVWPLAPSLDTVGPMARDVAGLVAGMALLEPGFGASLPAPAERVGRLRISSLDVDATINDAIDAALGAAGVVFGDAELDGWSDASVMCVKLLDWEAARSNRALTSDPVRRAKLGPSVIWRLDGADAVTDSDVAEARAFQPAWQRRLSELFLENQLLACPTVAFYPPPLEDAARHRYTALTNPVNLAGLPAVAIPVPSGGLFPASLQLIGPAGAEDLLLATAARVEAAVRL